MTNPAVGDGKSYLEQVTGMDTTTPANGVTFNTIHQQLVDNDTALMTLLKGFSAHAVNSGVVNYAAITAGLTSSVNAFKFGKDNSLVDGVMQALSNYGGMTDGTNMVQLDAPPSANVTPALPGSARDDLVFMEFWRSAPTGAWAAAIRHTDGVDFGTYPEGVNATNVYAQGGLSAASTINFAQATTISGQPFSSDSGLYVAQGTQTSLNTTDGNVYAIPLFRVRRRNSNPYNPDTNLFGASPYVPNQQTANTGTVAGGNLVYFSNGSTAAAVYQAAIGFTCLIGASNPYTITAVNATAGTITVSPALSSADAAWCLGGNFIGVPSGRPDGLYSNVIDATDIVDLRHQVSLTGFNYEALLEKNLDLLLRGQLNTFDTPRYARDYIGLNLAGLGYTDDVNSILFAPLNGNLNATADGAALTTTVSSGTASFLDGINGLAFNGASSSSQYWTLATQPALNSSWTLEFFMKPTFSWQGTQYQYPISILDSSGNSICSIFFATGDRRFFVSFPTAPNGQPNGEWSVAFDSLFSPGFNVGPVLANVWVKVKITYNGTSASIYVDGYQGGSNSTQPVTLPSTPMGRLQIVAQSCHMASIRLSNIVRTSPEPLPSNFSYFEGDRILDGPDSDFWYWSDDVGGTTGVNGRTNPYGLTSVPNQMAARVNYDGTEIRHYFGDGLTPGWGTNYGSIGSSPNGAFDFSGEYISPASPTSGNGTNTTFTIPRPPNAQGLFAIWDNSTSTSFTGSNYQFNVNGTGTSIQSLSLDSNQDLTVVMSSAPASGAGVGALYYTGQTHAHFIPSTKGFVIHDWTDDTFSGVSGTQTVFQTTKYNVNVVNHVRVMASGSTASFVQNGGYTVSGTYAVTSLTAASAVAASGATSSTITVASASNFVANQNIRISEGNGTWYTTTVTSISGTTITIPPLTVALSANATVEGTALVTFTTAPAASSTVDIVYESVKTPSLGDYIRIAYQRTPYQGVMSGSTISNALNLVAVHQEGVILGLTQGTGLNASSKSRLAAYDNAATRLPTYYPDYYLKYDLLTMNAPGAPSGTSPTIYRTPVIGTSSDGTATDAFDTGFFAFGGAGSAYTPPPSVRGFEAGGVFSDGHYLIPYGLGVTSSVPKLAVYPVLAANIPLNFGDLTNVPEGELILAVFTSYTSDSTVSMGGYSSTDFFRLQGRPLIKGYAGVTN